MISNSINGDSFYLIVNNMNRVAGAVTYDNKVATFTPTDGLPGGAHITTTITTAVTDTNNTQLQNNHTWSFDVAGTFDNTPPTLMSWTPSTDAVDIQRVSMIVTMTFSEPMELTSAENCQGTFSMQKSGDSICVAGTFSIDSNDANTVWFAPTNALESYTYYAVNVGVSSAKPKDLASNDMQNYQTWQFRSVNFLPTHYTGSATTAEDTPVEIVLTAGDVDNDPLTYGIAVHPSHGTVTCPGFPTEPTCT
jgi:hypothetical protein